MLAKALRCMFSQTHPQYGFDANAIFASNNVTLTAASLSNDVPPVVKLGLAFTLI